MDFGPLPGDGLYTYGVGFGNAVPGKEGWMADFRRDMAALGHAGLEEKVCYIQHDTRMCAPVDRFDVIVAGLKTLTGLATLRCPAPYDPDVPAKGNMTVPLLIAEPASGLLFQAMVSQKFADTWKAYGFCLYDNHVWVSSPDGRVERFRSLATCFLPGGRAGPVAVRDSPIFVPDAYDDYPGCRYAHHYNKAEDPGKED